MIRPECAILCNISEISFLIGSEPVTAVSKTVVLPWRSTPTKNLSACGETLPVLTTCWKRVPADFLRCFPDPPWLSVTDHHTSDLDKVNCLLTQPAALFLPSLSDVLPAAKLDSSIVKY